MVTVVEAQNVLREATKNAIREHSMLYTIQAILMVIGGIAAIVFPLLFSAAIVLMLGWLLILVGIVQGISLLSSDRGSHIWLHVISAVLSIWVGIIMIRNPGEGMVLITALLVVFMLVEGVAKIAFAFALRPFPNWGWVLVSGLIGVALALFLWMNMPGVAFWLIGLLVGIQLLSEGIGLGMLVVKSRSEAG